MLAGQGAGRCDTASESAAVSAGAQLNYESPRVLSGSIYDEGSKKLLFKFERRAIRSGDKLEVQRDYTYPDGAPAAQERVVYEGNQLTLYDLKEFQTGAAGNVTVGHKATNPARSELEFEYATEPGAKLKKGSENLVPNILINDMVAHFLVAHWNSLEHGEKVNCRYIVVSRKETVGFSFVKAAASTWEGRDAIIVRMEPSSKLLAALVKPLFFTIEKANPHRVLQYVGRTTPKAKEGTKWKDLDAVTVFDWAHAQP